MLRPNLSYNLVPKTLFCSKLRMCCLSDLQPWGFLVFRQGFLQDVELQSTTRITDFFVVRNSSGILVIDQVYQITPVNHTFPVREIQLRVAEFWCCFCLYIRTHSFHFLLLVTKSTRVAQVLEKYAVNQWWVRYLYSPAWWLGFRLVKRPGEHFAKKWSEQKMTVKEVVVLYGTYQKYINVWGPNSSWFQEKWTWVF